MSESIMLARQALQEWRKSGVVTVICPNCRKTPEVTITKEGDVPARMLVSCPCRYVLDGEIYL